jgi:small nuclear ribonucleoprotein (snRNP)-like protein
MHRRKAKVPTLITALQALEGIPITVELRNEIYIRGFVESVDNRMKYAFRTRRC